MIEGTDESGIKRLRRRDRRHAEAGAGRLAVVRLYVNVDHVATLRQQRGTRYPDPVAAATLCELAGADGITVHLREDRRHIQDRDVRVLRETVRGVLNLEMAATDEMLRIAREVKPDFCTLVPEKREEQTTEGGLTVAPGGTLEKVVRGLGGRGDRRQPVHRSRAAGGRGVGALGVGDRRAAHGRLLPGAARAERRAGAPAAAAGAGGARGRRLGPAPRARGTGSTTQRRAGGGARRARGAEHRPRPGGARGDDRDARRRRSSCATRSRRGRGVRDFPPLLTAAEMRAADAAATERAGRPEPAPDGERRTRRRRHRPARAGCAGGARGAATSPSSAARATTAATGSWPRGTSRGAGVAGPRAR